MAVVIGATRPCLVVGGRVFTDLTNLITLMGQLTTAGRNTTMGRTGNTGYQITTAKTYTIEALVVAGATSNAILVSYSDNNVGWNSATALTNPVYLANNNSGSYLRYSGNAPAGTDVWHPYFAVPASKYVNWSNSADSLGLCYGYEV